MSPELQIGKAVSNGPGLRTYLVQMQGTPNFERPSLMPRGEDRKTAVFNELMRVHRNAMDRATGPVREGGAPTLDALKAAGLVSGWTTDPMSNTMVIDVPDARAAEAYAALNKVDGIGRVLRNREVKLIGLQDAIAGASQLADEPTPPAKKIEWNVAKVGAPDVWAQGITGKGITVGIVDTGVDFNHPALAAKYRGRNADGTTTNDYNWFDAVNARVAPYDDNKHGTHVTGTVLGSTADYHTGMAPDAKYVASKILSGSGSGTLAGVMKGLSWMLAPTDVAGLNPDPTKAPDVVSNSWGTTNGKLDNFRSVISSMVAAGQVPVFAAGNSGPKPGTVGAPGSYPDVISVAATDKDDNVASFSSRGPSPIKGPDGSDRKPDVAAPGKDVMSSIPGGGYASFSGTSMATPGVSGVIALLLSKHNDLTQAEILKSLTSTAVDKGAPGYDYDYGYGRVDAKAALAAADALVAARPPKQAPPATPPAA